MTSPAPIMIRVTMLTMLWGLVAGPAWGVNIHGPIPDPSEAESQEQGKGRSDASGSSERKAPGEEATAAERARQQQYRDGEDSNPWFRYRKDAGTHRESPAHEPTEKARRE